jgi:uncharacterized protein (DUF736 family)
MANIGTFTKQGDSYTGRIFTIGINVKNVRILPEEPDDNDAAPSHRVFVGGADIGAAWEKVSREGRPYLSLKLDDPSFSAPIYASLFENEEDKSFDLIWTRTRTANGG